MTNLEGKGTAVFRMQPICESDWNRLYSMGERPRAVNELPRRCVFCNEKTEAGLYVNVEPATVRYPTAK